MRGVFSGILKEYSAFAANVVDVGLADAEEIFGQADNLQQLMRFFKVDGGARRTATPHAQATWA